MLNSLLKLLRRKHSFYEDLTDEQIPRYQHYVSLILHAIDVENNTKWSRGDKDYDRKILAADDKLLEEIISGQAASDGLSPVYLQIIVNQYFFADPYKREDDQSRWVLRVLNRKPTDYFPDPMATRKLLEAAS